MNGYLVLILGILVGKLLLDLFVEIKNLDSLDPKLPAEFAGFYEKNAYEKSQQYTRSKTRLGFFQTMVSTSVLVICILAGGFNALDLWVRGFSFSPPVTGVFYIVGLVVLSSLLNLPFGIYTTFVIEERFGFNRTGVKTFILDLIKSLILSLILGVPLLYVVLWFFETVGRWAPLFIWFIVVVYQLFVTWIAPVVIMPVFNKFIPLEDGELKKKIESYASDQNFQMKGVFQMDGSRRSSKSNAFFTGFGKSRRIVLFDTLVKNHSVSELLSILAHEMGHYKKRHMSKTLIVSVLETGILLVVLSFFINNPYLFAAFRMEYLSVYASMVFFGFIYSPVSMLLSVLGRMLSRRFEFQADRFAVESTGLKEEFITGLKRLSVHNLSNLTPHRLKVFFDYGHPPVLHRIEAIRKIQPFFKNF